MNLKSSFPSEKKSLISVFLAICGHVRLSIVCIAFVLYKIDFLDLGFL